MRSERVGAISFAVAFLHQHVRSTILEINATIGVITCQHPGAHRDLFVPGVVGTQPKSRAFEIPQAARANENKSVRYRMSNSQSTDEVE